MEPTVYSAVIEMLSSRPEGLSFNSFSKLLQGRVSRITLAKALEGLVKERIVEVERNLSHKQKKVFKLSYEVMPTVIEVNSLEEGLKADLSNFHLLLKSCRNIIRGSGHPYIKKYAEFKMNSLIVKLLHSS
jgi:hypothetical protein